MTACSNKKAEQPANEKIIIEITAPVEITFWHAMSGAQEEALKKLTATISSTKGLLTLTQAFLIVC